MDAGRLICNVAIGFIGLFLITVGASGAEPEQIHLAVTETQNEMVVQWGTEEDTQVSCNSPTEIEYGTESDSLDMSQSGTNEMYDWTTCIHTVILPDLEGDTTYYYRVGGNGEWSDVYSFTTHSTLLIADNDIRIGAIADHGTSSNAEETTENMLNADLDLVIHAGDISYADDVGSGNGFGDQTVWDEYQNQIEVLASQIPHMYAPGNHEEEGEPYGFEPYETRFYSPGSSSFWYSFNFEGVHIISLSTEHNYDVGSTQYSWLENDLEAAHDNREEVPWIVVFAHKPMYSSNNHGSETEFRDAMEELLYRYQVDLAIWGHDHGYERSYPVYQEEIYSNMAGTEDEPYYQPGATIHIVAGMAGRSLYEFEDPQPEWSYYREASDYGYTYFTVTSDGLLHYEYLRNDGTIGDDFWITKNEPEEGPDIVVDEEENNGNLTNETDNTSKGKNELPPVGMVMTIITILIVSSARKRS